MTPNQLLCQKLKKLARSLGCSIWPEYGPSGMCPVQAEGRICLPNKKPVRYYFRGRGQSVRMEFNGATPEASFVWHGSVEGAFAAGALSTAESLAFIEQAIKAWKSSFGRA